MTKAQRTRLRAIILALTFALSTGVAAAQSVPLVTFPFSMSGVGVGPQIPLAGQSSCAVVLSNAGTGLTLIPQASSDQGATWVTATTIGGGSISTIGSYVGGIAGTGLTTFRFVVSALTSGTVSGQETCSGAIGSETVSGGTVTAIQPTASLLNATVVGAGAAGAPSGGVVSIQGVAGGTGIPVTGAFFQTLQPVSCSTGSVCPTNATLQAGSAIAGKFGIDQTTPGTTNGVQVVAAIPTGANTIGNVNQTTGTSGYGFILDSAGTNVAGVDSSHNQLVKNNACTAANITTSGSSTLSVGSNTYYVCSATFSVWPTASAGSASLTSNTNTTCTGANTPLAQLNWPATITGYMSAPFNIGVSIPASGSLCSIVSNANTLVLQWTSHS